MTPQAKAKAGVAMTPQAKTIFGHFEHLIFRTSAQQWAFGRGPPVKLIDKVWCKSHPYPWTVDEKETDETDEEETDKDETTK